MVDGEMVDGRVGEWWSGGVVEWLIVDGGVVDERVVDGGVEEITGERTITLTSEVQLKTNKSINHLLRNF